MTKVSVLTSSGRSHNYHANLFSGRRGARCAPLQLLNARVEVADDLFQLLQLILDETHDRNKVEGLGSSGGSQLVNSTLPGAEGELTPWRVARIEI